jgi:hypothetical protein
MMPRNHAPVSLLAVLALAACGGDEPAVRKSPAHSDEAVDSATATGSSTDPSTDTATDTDAPVHGPSGACGFPWVAAFHAARRPLPVRGAPHGPHTFDAAADGGIRYAEPLPTGTFLRRSQLGEITLPDYGDTMPLFARAAAWSGTRCFETPDGATWLTEADAFALYQQVAERTTGQPLDTAPGARAVLGIRGAFPGTFAWNGNTPNVFDDTLVLLTVDADGTRHVREFPVNTDTGAYDFGTNGASSLKANRRYHHEGGWHRGSYEALTIAESGYRTVDDTNHNGHVDSDRNGWLPPSGGEDHERVGGGHNIHVASVDGPLETAQVRRWSAGCQTIPGMANWTTFIERAWPGNGNDVDYFLVDARDIDPEVFGGSCTPDGTRECPYRIPSLPYTDQRSTVAAPSDAFSAYNCSGADERGPENAYLLLVDDYGTLEISVDDTDADIDVHLLDAADPDACVDRDDTDLVHDVQPGRYWIVADSYVDGGSVLAGEYTLHVRWR